MNQHGRESPLGGRDWILPSGSHRLTRTRRSGVSLIELLIAISLTSLVLATIGYSLHLVHRAGQLLRDDIAYEAVLPRLASRIRGDVHAAVTMQQTRRAGMRVVSFARLQGDRAEYWAAGGAIERRLVVDGEPVHTERFVFEAEPEFRWTRAESDEALVQLRVQCAPQGSAAARLDTVEAVLGLDHRNAND